MAWGGRVTRGEEGWWRNCRKLKVIQSAWSHVVLHNTCPMMWLCVCQVFNSVQCMHLLSLQECFCNCRSGCKWLCTSLYVMCCIAENDACNCNTRLAWEDTLSSDSHHIVTKCANCHQTQSQYFHWIGQYAYMPICMGPMLWISVILDVWRTWGSCRLYIVYAVA